MHFIDEQDVTCPQVGQDGCQVASPFNGGTGSDLDVDTHFGREYVCQSGFSKSGRSVEKNVLEGFLALLGSLDLDAQVFLDQVLPDQFIQR